MRFFITLLLIGSVMYVFVEWNRRRGAGSTPPKEGMSRNRLWFRGKKNPQEIWVQVYETASMEEARGLQARLQEEELECVLYEQGKKDIHGQSLKGVGIAVPKPAVPRAQGIISRMPV